MVQEMIGRISLELVEKRLVTDQLVLTVGYDIENLTRPEIRKVYKGTGNNRSLRAACAEACTWNVESAACDFVLKRASGGDGGSV